MSDAPSNTQNTTFPNQNTPQPPVNQQVAQSSSVAQASIPTTEGNEVGGVVKQIEESNTKMFSILGDSLAQQNKLLQKTWIWFSVFIGLPLILLVVAIFIIIMFTIFFLFFPKQTAHLFSVGVPDEKVQIANLPQTSRAVLGTATGPNATVPQSIATNFFCPFASVSLQIVRQVRPSVYSEVAPQVVCGKQTIIQSSDAISLQGKSPGNLPGDVAIIGPNGTIAGVKFNTENIVPGSITTNLLAPESVTGKVIANNAVTSVAIADGSITNEDISDAAQISDTKLTQIATANKVAGSSVQLASGGGLVNNAGVSLLNTCSSNQVLIWDGSSWKCGAQSSNPGTITGVTAGDGLTGGGTSGTVTVSVQLPISGTSSNTSSNSGLELSTSGVSLLRGCSDSQVLAWNGTTHLWECANQTGGGGGIGTVQEGGGTVVTSASTINFGASDFNVTNAGAGIATIALDYASSKITRSNQNETITGSYTYSSPTPITLSSTSPKIAIGDTGTLAITDGTNTLLSVADTGTTGVLTVSGGLTVSNGSVSFPAASIANAALANSSVSIAAGTGLSGGGSVSLGGTTTVNLANTAVTPGSYGSSGTTVPTFTVDQQGRITTAGSYTISGITASNLTAGDFSSKINSGTYSINVSGSAGSATTATTATNANNVATIATTTNASFFPLFVSLSTNGNQAVNLGAGLTFNPSSNTLTTTTFSGALSGNASTATALQTARAINGVSFDGTGNITVAAAAGTLTGTTLASNVVSSSLTSLGTLTGLTVGGGSVSFPAASISTSALTANSITVNPTAGTGISISGSPVSLGGTVTVAGVDATTSTKGVASFNSGNFSVTSGDVTIKTDGVGPTELAATTVSNGSYGSSTAVPTFTVDADGRLTAAGTTTLSAGGITSNTLDFSQFADNMTLDATTSIALGNSNLAIGTNTGIGNVSIAPNAGGNAALVVNTQGVGDILTASTSGVTKFVLNNSGSVLLTAGQGVDTLTTGSLVLGASTANAITLSQNTTISGSKTLSTGTGAVSLNGDTAIASGKLFTITGGSGNPTATNGTIWYDTTAGKFKIVEGGTVKIICNTTDLGCGTGGGGISTVKEGGTSIVTSATAVNFNANDFAITDETGGQAGIALDYTNSHVTRSNQAETITGGYTFSTATTTFTTAINANGGVTTSSADQNLNLSANGVGNVRVSTNAGGQAAFLVNDTGIGDIFTASTSGTPKFTIANTGNITAIGSLTGLTGLTVSSGTVSLPNGQIDNAELANSNLTITAGAGLSGGGSVSLGGSTTLNLANTAVTPGSYGTSGLTVPTFTVDQQGRVSAAGSYVIQDATTGQKGVASFAAANFSVSSGAVSIATNGVGSTELAATTVSNGSYGSSTAVPTFTVDADGRLTAAGTTTLSAGGITSNTLDFGEFADAMTLDATTSIALQNFTYTLGNNAGNGNVIVSPDAGGNAALVVNKQGASGDILTASSSGTPKFTIKSNGDIQATGALIGATIAAGSNTITGLTASNFTAGDFSSVINSGTYSINISGSAGSATTATNANNVATTSTITNASFFPLFVSSSSNSNQAVNLGTGLTFNPSSNTLTTTTFSGALSGNATTATTLQTARNINGVSFNGSADITIAAAAGTLTGTTLASNVVSSSLTSVGNLVAGTIIGTTTFNSHQIIDNGALVVTSASGSDLTLGQNAGNGTVRITPNAGGQASLIINNLGTGDLLTASVSGAPRFTVTAAGGVSASGNISAANFSGTSSGTNTGDQTITLTGDVTGSGTSSFSTTVTKINGATLGTTTATDKNILIADGSQWVSRALSGDATISNTGTLTLKNTGTSGTYGSSTQVPVFTTDAQGRVTSVTNTDIAIGASNIAANSLDFGQFTDNMTLDASTTIALQNFNLTLGTSSGIGTVLVNSNAGGQASFIANNQGTGDILTASASGTPKFTIARSGNITATGTLTGLTGLTVASGSVSLPSSSLATSALTGTIFTADATSGTTSQSVAAGGTLTFSAGTDITTTGAAGSITFADASTLNSVTGRGASTANALTLSSTSNNITAGTLTINSDAFTDLTGNGLTISGGALGIATGGVGTNELAANAVTGAKIANNTIGFGQIADSTTLDANTTFALSGFNLTLGDNSGGVGTVIVSPNAGGQASLIIKNQGGGDLLTASAGATTKFTVKANGDIQATGALTGATIAAGSNTITGLTASNLTAGDFSSAINSGTYSINISGSAGSATSATTATNANNINLANDTTNATDYLVFTNTATGNQPLKTNTGISVNPSTGVLSATTFSGALSGNATTATTLQTARNINGVSFNGSADITVTAAAGTLTGNTLNSGVTASSLTSVGNLVTGTVIGTDTFGSHTITDTGALTLATSTNGDLTLTPNGTGNVVLTATGVSGVRVGSSTNTPAVLSVSGGIGNNAALIVNNNNNGNLLVASSSGTAKFVVDTNGNITAGTYNGNTISSGTGVLTLGASKTLTVNDTTTLNTNSITLAGGENITLTAAKSVSFADAFTTSGANALTLTTTGTTSVTLPTSGTLVNTGVTTLSSLTTVGSLVAGTVVGTNTFNSHSIVDSGALAITAASGSNLTLGQNVGNGTIIISPNAGGQAALILNDQGLGDLFTASAGGTTKFVVDKNGQVGIGQSVPTALLDVEGTVNGVGGTSPVGIFKNLGTGDIAEFFGSGGLKAYITNSGSLVGNGIYDPNNASTGIFVCTNSCGNQSMQLGGQAVLGANTILTPKAMLDVRIPTYLTLGTQPIATFSGKTSFAGVVIDQSGVGDIFTASASGLPRFVIANGGGVNIFGGQTSDVDTIGTSNTLKIGAVNQNGLTLGRAGAATTINGSSLTIGATSWTATPTISGLITASSGVSVAAGQSYTGAGAVTLSSGGSGNVALNPASGTLTSNATTINFSGAALTVSSCTGCIAGVTLQTDYNAGNTINLSNNNLIIGNSPTGVGNVLINPDAGGKAALIVNKAVATGDIFAASSSGTTRFSINNNGNLVATGSLTGLTGLTVASGAVSLPANSIANAALANSAITVSATAGTGISVSGSPVSLGGTLTVAGTDATTGQKGVASFNSSNFSVASGAVSLATGGVGETNIAVDSLDFAELKDVMTLDANTTFALSTFNLTLGDNSGGIGNVLVSPNAGGNAALIINKQAATGDIFSASASGTTKFTVSNVGTLTQTISTAADAHDMNFTLTSGTATNGLAVTLNGSGGTLTNAINITQTAGTLSNGLNISGLVTAATGGTVNGIQLATAGLTVSTAATANLRGIFFNSPSALVTNTNASATINWDGVNITTPNITQTTGSLTANGLKITNGSIITGGTQDGILIAGSSSNAAGNQNAIKINNITAGGATDNGIVIGTGWDNGLLVQSTASFTQTTAQTGINIDYGTNFTAASGQNLTGISITTPTLTSTGTQTYNGLILAGNAITTNTGANVTYNGISVTTPNITLTAGLAAVNGAKITIGTTGVGGTQNGILITPPGTTNASSTTDGINIGNITTSNGTDTAIAIGTGWDNAILGAGAISINTSSGNITLQPAGSSTTANVQIGAGGSGSGTPDLLVMDAKNTAGDPTAVNGAVYYNASTNELKCAENSAWSHCGGWQFLGRATWSSGNTVGPIVLTTTRKHLEIRGQIVYGASGIARIRFGNAAIDTGTTYNSKVSESAAAATTWTITNTASQNGVPVANTAVNTQRSFVAEVEPNASSVVKRVYIRSNSNSTSAGTVDDAAEVWGMWVPSTATDVINRVDLIGCTANATSCSAANFAAGTEIEVWGRDDD